MSAPWSISHYPNATAQATASLAAPTNAAASLLVTRLRALQVTVAAAATVQTPIEVVVRDGDTGAGTILWAAALAAPADGVGVIALSDLDLRATPGNALTVEFTAAGVANSQEAVNAQGDFVKPGYPAFQP